MFVLFFSCFAMRLIELAQWQCKIRNAPAGQRTVRILSQEEWENIQEVRPRTPFESKLTRPNAQLRADGPIRMVKAVRGIKIEVTHQGNVRRKYRVSGLTSQPTRDRVNV